MAAVQAESLTEGESGLAVKPANIPFGVLVSGSSICKLICYFNVYLRFVLTFTDWWYVGRI